MSRVKPFTREAVPEVASLIWNFLYKRRGLVPASFETYLHELFFCSPYADADFPSLVYADDRGTIRGFLGVVSRPMLIGQQRVRATSGSSFIVHPESRSTPAPLELVRTYFSRGQDLSFSDTANATSQALWKAFGGTAVPGSDLHWSRPLRPVSYCFHALSHAVKAKMPFVSRAVTRLCRTADRLASGALVPERSFPPGLHAVELDAETLLSLMRVSSKRDAIRPSYSRASADWLLRFMARMRAYGELRKVAVKDESSNAIGCYVYYARPHGIGELAYFGATAKHAGIVLDHLFADAASLGLIALHGKLDPPIASQLSGRLRFVYNGRDPLLVRGHRPDLAEALQKGAVSISRLDGEWSLKFGAEGLTDDLLEEATAASGLRQSKQVVQPWPKLPRTQVHTSH